MVGVPRERALDAFLYRLRTPTAEEILRPFPQGRGHRLGQAAESAAAGAPSRRKIRCPARERVAARTHRLDEILSACSRHDDVACAAEIRRRSHIWRLRRWGHLPDAAARRRD